MNEFDASHRIFVSYIDKSREYYLARGYRNPYRWARYEDAPFAPLAKPLNQSRVALITTASLPGEERSLTEVYAAPTAPPPPPQSPSPVHHRSAPCPVARKE